jgi:hypothetical protein
MTAEPLDERPAGRVTGAGRLAVSARTRAAVERDITDLLVQSDVLPTIDERQLLIEHVEQEMATELSIPEHSVARLHLAAIVDRCRRSADGLPALALIFAHLFGRLPQAAQLWRLTDEWQVLGLFEDDELEAIRGVLGDLTVAEIRADWRAALGHRDEGPPEHCDTGWDAFANLVCRGSPPTGTPPAMTFLLRVAGRVEAGHEATLRVFAAGWAERWALPVPAVTRVAELPLPACVVIQITPAEDDQFLVSHWRQGAADSWKPKRQRDRRSTRDRLERIVEELITEAETAWAEESGEATLQFILPLELLDLPVEWWERDSDARYPTPLLVDYPVNLRSLERLRAAHLHRVWKRRWRRLAEQPDTALWHRSEPAGDDHPARLERTLKTVPEYVSLVLSEAPAPDGTGADELIAGLRAGLPVIVWDRRDCSDPEFLRAVRDLLRPGTGLALIPARARELKLGDFDTDGARGPGRHMAVLFDDPGQKVTGNAASEGKARG